MKTLVLFSVFLCLGVLSRTQAAVMLIDFGTGNGATTGDYNTVTNNSNTPLPLIDDGGAATGISLATDGGSFAGAGANYAGPFPASVGSEPATALQDSLFIRDTFNGNTATITLSGLSNLETYDLLIYGARGNNGVGAIFTVIDESGSSVGNISNVFNNATETVSFNELVPDGSNEITLLFTSVEANTSGAALNFMSITSNPVPEPGSLAFLCFSALMLLGRRSRR